MVGAAGAIHAIGFLLMTRITELWQVYVIWGLMGTANAMTYIPIMSTIARWFTARRTTAIGITIAGFAAGAIFWPPMAQWLIDEIKWRGAFLVLSIISAAGVIPFALFLKTSPSAAGMEPYGHGAAMTIRSERPATPTLTLAQSAKTVRFWLWMAILFCFYSSLSVLFVHIVAHARDIHVPPIIAAGTLSIIAGCSIIARVTIGSIADRIDARVALVAAIGLAVLAFALLVASPQLWTFYTFAVIYGLAYGSFVPLETEVPARLFGLGSLGAIMATAGFLSSLGSAFGPPLAGAIFDATKKYQIAFVIALALVVVGLVLSIWLLRLKGQHGDGPARPNGESG
jgi:MFS family permease